MRVTFSSNPELWLKPAQILSYFSRYTSEVRKKGITEFKPDEEQAREEASTTIAEEPPENNIYQEPYEDQEQVSYLTTVLPDGLSKYVNQKTNHHEGKNHNKCDHVTMRPRVLGYPLGMCRNTS